MSLKQAVLETAHALATHSTTFRPALLAGVAVALGVVAPTHGGVTNGSFEQPTVPVGSYASFPAGSTAITGWTVVGAEVAVINTSYVDQGLAFPAQHGEQWVDLAGDGSNSPTDGLTQNVVTTIGQSYRLSFYVGSGTNNTSYFASTVDLSIDGGGRISFTNPFAPQGALNWRIFSADFVATGGMTNITFYNGSANNNYVSCLDNVSLEVVPAPGAAAVLGLGGLVLSRRRRS